MPELASSPLPVLPTYSGPCNRGIIPALLGPSTGARPAWFPAVARTPGTRVVVLVLDGLGWEQLSARATLAPTLAAMQGGPITTVAPSTTSTALTSITTGLTPAEHGVVGYRVDLAGDIVNMLRWTTSKGDVRRQHLPRDVQPFEPFLGESIVAISKTDFDSTAFTEAHMRGSRLRSWRLPSNLPIRIGEVLRAGERVVYAYYDGIDKVAHEHGFGPYYDAELRFADALVAAVIEQLPDDTVLLVTADHGQVDVGPKGVITPDRAVLDGVRYQSGEGRFRWLHAKQGAAASVVDTARDLYAEHTWVVAREQVLDEGWLGPVISAPVAKRLGDVALVPFAPVSFDDPADTGAFTLMCRHGSLTSAEMLVPLLAAAGR